MHGRTSQIELASSVGPIVARVSYKPIRNIYLRVKSAEGPVELSVPLFFSHNQTEEFLLQHAGWIAQQRQRRQAESQRDLAIDMAGGRISYWGERLRLERTTSPLVKIEATDEVLRLSLPDLVTVREARLRLNRWLCEQLAEALAPLLERWTQELGVTVRLWRLRTMKSRWGSCAIRRGTITINSDLVHYPPACLEYIVVHELLHLLVPHHNRTFYRLLEHFLPEWREAERELKEGRLL